MDLSFTTTAPNLPGLFEAAFSASEGAEEGAAIATLVATLHKEPLARPFTALTGGEAIAGVVFTPISYVSGPDVQLLSPMAVLPEHQGKGVGQALIRHALSVLKTEGAAATVTYGDPAFYGKVGFQPVTVDTLPAPAPLSMPFGWQAQPLAADELPTVTGPATTVAAFADPALW